MRFEEKIAKPSRVRCVVSCLLLCFMLAGANSALAQTPQRNEPIDKDPNNWLTFYGNHQGWSYSRLNQITRENVKQLQPVWAFPAGFAPTNLGLRQGLEAAPLVLDGVLYLEGMQNNLYAIEATAGRAALLHRVAHQPVVIAQITIQPFVFVVFVLASVLPPASLLQDHNRKSGHRQLLGHDPSGGSGTDDNEIDPCIAEHLYRFFELHQERLRAAPRTFSSTVDASSSFLARSPGVSRSCSTSKVRSMP